MGKSKREQQATEESMTEQPSAKKVKKELVADEVDTSVAQGTGLAELPYADKLHYVSVIAQPMAGKKLAKKLFKLIKKASKQKTYLRAGLRDVQMRLRKGERGVVVFAGDVTPVEVGCG